MAIVGFQEGKNHSKLAGSYVIFTERIIMITKKFLFPWLYTLETASSAVLRVTHGE